MKIFKIKVTENITGFVEIAADDLFVAENIARAALHDEGLGAFPNLETTSRDTDADGLYDKDLDTTDEKKEQD